MNNEFVCQFLADMLGKPIEIPKSTETTAIGVAYLAGLQVGIYEGIGDIEKAWKCERRYDPNMDSATRDQLYDGWKIAIGQLLG